jgi:hypothetical protein
MSYLLFVEALSLHSPGALRPLLVHIEVAAMPLLQFMYFMTLAGLIKLLEK